MQKSQMLAASLVVAASTNFEVIAFARRTKMNISYEKDFNFMHG